MLRFTAWILAFVAGGEEPAKYTFTLDGESIDPFVISMEGTPDRPAAGDLVAIDGIFLVLGPEREHRLHSTKEGTILLEAGGKTKAIGAKVEWTFLDLADGRKQVLVNPLSKMSDEEVRGLRGIRYETIRPREAFERLKAIDPERCCIAIDESDSGNYALPPLPAGLRHLDIRLLNGKLEEASRLADLRALRSISIDVQGPVDLVLLRNCHDLRHLDASSQNLQHTEALQELTALREIDFRGARGVTEIGYTGRLENLVSLRLDHTEVADLSPAGVLARIERLSASAAPVAKLPEGPMPALRRLDVLSTKLSDAVVNGFATSHPACRIRHRWAKAMVDALADADRLRVRSGGTCHRSQGTEITLFEEKGRPQVAEIVGKIAIDEAHSNFHCMCCGDPSFEFYRGDELVLTIGFHHGKGLRWPGGWPGDAALAPESAGFLAEWLAEHGVREPKAEREESTRRDDAARRRWDFYRKALPASALEAIEAEEDPDEVRATIEKEMPDGVARAAAYLRCFGCDDGAWSHTGALDGLFTMTLLPSVEAGDLGRAMAKAGEDPMLADGAARWLLNERKWEDVEAETLQKVLPAIALRALGHPKDDNRHRAIASLEKIEVDAARYALRSLLAGKIEPRELPAGPAVEAGAMVTYVPWDRDVRKDCSDRANAALALARRGDQESLDAIRMLARSAAGKDIEALEDAVRLLGKGK